MLVALDGEGDCFTALPAPHVEVEIARARPDKEVEVVVWF